MEKRDVLADTTARQEAETVLPPCENRGLPQLAPACRWMLRTDRRATSHRRRTDSFPPVLRPLAIMVE